MDTMIRPVDVKQEQHDRFESGGPGDQSPARLRRPPDGGAARRVAGTFESQRNFSADEVAAELNARGIRLGKATIYRTLALLVELGLATEHDFDEGFKRYQMQLGAARHDHLICTGCGRVFPFDHPDVDRALATVTEDAGFAPLTRHIKIFGTCHECT
jgi:Fur family ferric uptake transcriptional regulator